MKDGLQTDRQNKREGLTEGDRGREKERDGERGKKAIEATEGKGERKGTVEKIEVLCLFLALAASLPLLFLFLFEFNFLLKFLTLFSAPAKSPGGRMTKAL